MKLSIAVCTHNEGHYVHTLLKRLTEVAKRNPPGMYEIVVVDDFSTDQHTLDALLTAHTRGIMLHQHALNGDFATHKNFMNSVCTGDWILNLDADETLSDAFLDTIPLYIESNPEVDAYWLPRVNTVDGLTLKHVQKWGWVLTTLPEFTKAKVIDPASAEYELLKAYNFVISEENGFVTYHQPIIQWPDMQLRLYRNTPDIRWEGRVHETLRGYENYTSFPTHPDYAILHHKEIARQEVQNDYYETIQR